MGFFRWVGTIFGVMGDHTGHQDPRPMTTPVPNARPMTPDSAMQLSAVYACTDLLSRTMGTLPCDVYTRDAEGHRVRDTLCNLHWIVASSPNACMTPYEFWSTMTMHWALRGNAYALISARSDTGEVRSLTPLNPDQMDVEVDPESGKVRYFYTDKFGKIRELPQARVFHWKNIGNGIVGMSRTDFMKATLDETAKAQQSAVDIYGKKGRASGVLTAQQVLNDRQKREISEQFSRMEDGGIPVLPVGFEFRQLSLTPADTQLLETRRFNVEDICRWFGVPPILLGGTGGTSDVEAAMQIFYKMTILPMCVSAQQALMKRVACRSERSTHEVEFRLGYLNRATDEKRYAMNAQALQNGWKTRNEVRLEEGLEPVPGADELTAQNNLMPLDSLGIQDPTQIRQTPLREEPIRQ